MFIVPEEFRHRPFLRTEALASGITRSVLQGPQFRRVHESVYCHTDHVPSFEDRLMAARLTLPHDALTTGITRLQELGVDFGPRAPLHFVVEGDLHLAIDGIFLHRTVKLPSGDGEGVTAEAAFGAYCAEARMIDAIKVGCELLRLGRLDLHLLDQFLSEEKWRRGGPETTYVLAFLDDRFRSMPEVELLTYVVAAGLPLPEINHTITLEDGTELTPDEWFGPYAFAVEYEGSHHQEERGQYTADIDRYAAYRRNDVAYEQVTKELMRSPMVVVRRIHAALVTRGYDGDPPAFGEGWASLFRPVRELVRPPKVPRQR